MHRVANSRGSRTPRVIPESLNSDWICCLNAHENKREKYRVQDHNHLSFKTMRQLDVIHELLICQIDHIRGTKDINLFSFHFTRLFPRQFILFPIYHRPNTLTPKFNDIPKVELAASAYELLV